MSFTFLQLNWIWVNYSVSFYVQSISDEIVETGSNCYSYTIYYEAILQLTRHTSA